MYSNEDRIKAIKLYIEYEFCARAVIRELGYPSRNRLAKWYKVYQERGSFDYCENRHSCKASRSLIRCTKEQKEQAVKDYCAGVYTPTELG